MKRILINLSLIVTLGLSTAAWAGVIQTWDLTNKSPGALGADYGLRLNQIDSLIAVGDGSNRMIFDFERLGHGVSLQLVDVGGGDLELHLAGTAYGALHDGGAANGYGSGFAGTYALDFIWRNVQQNAGGFDLVAELNLGSYMEGDGSGTVLGIGPGTAFMGANALTLYDWSGSYTHTLDVLAANTPDASGWLTYGTGGHNGDYGFNMVARVPEPGTLSLIGLGLIGLGLSRRRKRE